MILTVTPNPSIDITLELDRLAIGEINRAERAVKDPAGKGINVARALMRNGVLASAIFPADHSSGAWILEALGHLGVPTVTVPILGEVRQNITLVEANGTTTKVNQSGPRLTDVEQHSLLARVADLLEANPAWLVVAGSLPGGVDGTFYVRLGELARNAGARFACDSSGRALAVVARSGIADLLKPNHEELEELAGRSLATVGEVVEMVRSLPGGPDRVVVVSLGKHGALAITPDQTRWAAHPPVTAQSTVGAGDCTLAGYLAHDARVRHEAVSEVDPLGARLVEAVAWGTAAVQLPGTTVPAPEHIHRDKVRLVHNPSPHTPIEELAA